MEFFLYLTPLGREIVTNIMSRNYLVQENAPICKKYNEIFGHNGEGKFIICTDNIKNNTGLVSHYVNETVYHEAAHAAQSCKRSPIGIKNINLSAEKLNDVRRSVNYNKFAFVYEVEAYHLEDKPAEVLSYLKKYCF